MLSSTSGPYLLSSLNLKGFFSYGDWKYDKNATSKTFDDNLNPVKPIDKNGDVIESQTLYLKDRKVPNAAQLTFGLGFDYDLFQGVHALANWKYNGTLHADYNPLDFLGEANKEKKQIELPDYNLFDAGLYYNWTLKDGNSLRFQVNVDKPLRYGLLLPNAR